MKAGKRFWLGVCGALIAYPAALLAETASGIPPSGTLLYSRLTEDTWQIWQTDLATRQSTQITFTPGDKRRPAFGSEGRITYCTANQTCFMSRLGKGEERLLPDLWPLRDIVWSPDGRRLAFSKLRTDLADSANLWLTEGAGEQRRVVTHDPGMQQHPAWSRDGQWLAYSSGQGWGTYEIFVVRADGSEQRQLTFNQVHDFFPAWSPDGTRIAFSSDRSEGADYDIWAMNADGTDVKQLTQTAGLDTNPAWSPDGNWIAFATNRSGTMELWIMRPDGTAQHVLEKSEGGLCDPAWR